MTNKKNIVILANCRSGHNFVIQQVKSWTNELVYNFEDVRPIDYEKSKKHMVSNGKLFDSGNETIVLIVVRDLLNWWASYLKWITKDNLFSSEVKLQNAFDIWKSIFKEAYSITNYIPGKVLINYDLFHKSKQFRQSICTLIGGNYSEIELNTVVGAGGGSSFDKQTLPGNELKTDTRYNQILNSDLKDLYLKMLLKNKESIDLYTKYTAISLL